MITQIEIDGFKTFKDFKVELAPFQVIVGPNGSGKSNLFDALQLLSLLTNKDFDEAFQKMDESAGEVFTKYPDGSTSNTIRIALGVLVGHKMDVWQKEFNIKYQRLRYEIEIVSQKDVQDGYPMMKRESLRSITQDKDSWSKKYNLSSKNGWLAAISDEKIFFDNTEIKGFSQEGRFVLLAGIGILPSLSLHDVQDDMDEIIHFYAV
jgi:AAA15 family ATPase/GTPase